MPKSKMLHTLFNDSNYTYAIIDAAKIEELTTQLLIYEPLHCNLFVGQDAVELEEVAPYLVKLEKEAHFTHWVMEEVYGNNGAIFVQSSYDIKSLAAHFRPYLHVSREINHPETGERVIQEGILAYYDPRVLPEWLESVEPMVMQKFLSMTSMLYYEDIYHKHLIHSYSLQAEKSIHATHNLKEVLL